MPGRELATALDIDSSNLTSLKAHKALPRRAHEQTRAQDLSPARRQEVYEANLHSDYDDTSHPSDSSQLTLSSITTERPPGLPPTPPTISQDTAGLDSVTEDTTPLGWATAPSSRYDPGLTTPPIQRSPPTPDITPPKSKQYHSMLNPQQGNQVPSSGTASFKTALEDQWSSDDGLSPQMLDSAHTLRPQQRPRNEPHAMSDHGLGLATEAEDSDTDRTPTKRKNAHEIGSSKQGGERSRHRKLGAADKGWDDDLMRNVTVRKKRAPTAEPTPVNARKENSRGDSPPKPDQGMELSLRERLERKRESADRSSTERFAEQISWPSTDDTPRPATPLSETDHRRFSGLSNTSTIVEAMVYDDSPPRKLPKLRHYGKISALRELSTSQARSVSLPTPSSTKRHSLVHKNSPLPDRNRWSYTSDTSASAKSVDRSRNESQYRGEVNADSDGQSYLTWAVSNMLGRESQSLASASAQSQIPPLSNNHGYFDMPKRRKRAVSDLASASSKAEVRGRDFSPVVPPRSSSLSAPTSRNASRTTSLTSSSVRLGNVSRALVDTSAQPVQNSRFEQRLRKLSPAAESQLSPRYLAAPAISRSLSSNVSTPEALEVSQATAVSIYPHNNNSVLVVQQRSRPTSQEYANTYASANGPATPPTISLPIQQVDSPLRNPRDAPEPPAVKLIPPTPHPLTPSEEVDDPIENTTKRPSVVRTPSGRAFSIVKRALSNHRYSDGFVSPFTRLKGSNDVQQAPEMKDSKLYPFWRPRGFWDDLELADNDIEEEFLERGRSELLETPAPRTRRMSLPIMDHDGAERGGFFQRREPLSDNTVGLKSSRHQRQHSLPKLGPKLPHVRFGKLQRRLRDMKAERAEKAKERERNDMKRMISTPIGIEPEPL
ncbi:MAG: hypothetical protein M1833_002220 [Piccolia ochrophora]|nr:MAG: hypothetical protein M1833_002220 [Piccolia ochrophora]